MREHQYISAKNESPRMFKSDFFDYFSRAHPVIVPIIYLPIVAWFIYEAFAWYGIGILPAAGWFFGGILFWTAFEYFLHRYVFHLHVNSEFGKKFHFYVHGVHHDYPNDMMRLVIPPGASAVLAVLMYWVFYVFFVLFGGDYGSLSVFYAAFVLGYVCYDLMHYATHYYNFKSKWFQTIKRNHLDHHYVDHDKGFGLSNVYWDLLFKTEQNSIKKKRAKKKEQAGSK